MIPSQWKFNYFYVDIISVICYIRSMRDASFFTHPRHAWQRRYEALRALLVDRLPAKAVADRFGFSIAYVYLLRHLFVHEKLDFSEPVPEGTAKRRINAEIRQKIRSWRGNRLSAGEIAQLLSEQGIEISVRTVERILAEEGFSKLPRRSRLKLGLTVKEALVPERSERITVGQLDGRSIECEAAGVFLFAPFLETLHIEVILQRASLPGTKVIPANQYLLSLLALKLIGTERYAHVGDHAFDEGLGIFAGLNVLPKCTALSTYSYRCDEVHLQRLRSGFVKEASKLALYDGKVINLDFHSVPHWGEESVLEKHWVGTRGKAMKAALTLFAQDATSKLILYSAADIRRSESDDQVLAFLAFWKKIRREIHPTLIFDSRFTTYPKLSQLNAHGVKFITLQRRGDKMLSNIEKLTPWQRIHIPHDKRLYPNPQVHDRAITLKGYHGPIRQVIARGNGHEKPTFLISNDFQAPVELIVGNYARRWRVENVISEAVKFFHLNALSSPILLKVHLDVILTMVADTLYHMLAQKLRGFEHCDAPSLYRHFVHGKATVQIRGAQIIVTYPRRAHNPILRAVPWHRLPNSLPGLPGANLTLKFL